MRFRRLAALGLAAVNKNDRRWVFDRLTPVERSRLAPVLQEALTFPREQLHELIEKIESTSFLTEPIVAPVDRSDDLARVSRATLHDMVPLLNELPTACVALLLDAVDWRWADEYWSMLSAERRQVLATAPPGGKSAVSDEFTALLVTTISRRLQTVLEDAPQAPTRFEAVMSRHVPPLKLLL